MKTQQGRHKRNMFSLHSPFSTKEKENAENAHIQHRQRTQKEKLHDRFAKRKIITFFIIWKISGRKLKCHIVTYLEEFGDCRIHNHQRAMNQVNDSISHRNISHHDLGQHDAGGVLWIANNRIRLDIHCANKSSVIRINKPLNWATYFWFVCHRFG